MKKIKTAEAIGPALDWLVARCEGVPASDIRFDGRRIYRWMRDGEGKLTGSYMTGPEFLFSSMWETGGPIIEREEIQVMFMVHGFRGPTWYSRIGGAPIEYGSTPLIAAMRCYVASKFGDEAEVPEELL